MSHDHGDAHAAAQGRGRAFALAVALNLAFTAIEAIFGVLAGSTALLAEAAHNLSDVLGLSLAWGASALARRAPSRLHTYGLRRSTVLAALANAVLLLAAVGGVAWESIGRLRVPGEPQPPPAGPALALGTAAIGTGTDPNDSALTQNEAPHALQRTSGSESPSFEDLSPQRSAGAGGRAA